MKQLRPYQTDTINNLRETLRQGVKRVVVQLPTGAGKTIIAGQVISLAQEKGRKVAFVCPAISLIDQTVESFWAHDIRDIGVLQGAHHLTDYSKPVSVCSIQTLQARKFYPDCDLVIFDEVHRLFEWHKTWLTHPDWQNVPMIGLSATPWTKGLGKYFNSLLIAATTADLIEQGYLSKFRVFATGHPDLSEVKTVAGDYHEGQLSHAMQQGELTADIIRTWQQKWGQGKTLCFGVDKAHAKSIQERFEFAGISCGYQDADTSADERREIKRKFHSGEYQVVSNIQTLTTGVDWDVRCLILARPTRSEMLFVQIIGRALRTADGKEDALILDHSDTTAKLGFVTDIHHEHLDDGKPAAKTIAEKKEPLPKECSNCAYLKPPKTKICPNCGHESKIKSDIMEADGELVEWKPGKRGPKSKPKSAGDYTDAERVLFFRELKAYAIAHDYKPGWPTVKWKDKFNMWPPRFYNQLLPAEEISPTVSLWIRSQNIRWAKSKRNQSVAPDAQ